MLPRGREKGWFESVDVLGEGDWGKYIPRSRGMRLVGWPFAMEDDINSRRCCLWTEGGREMGEENGDERNHILVLLFKDCDAAWGR